MIFRTNYLSSPTNFRAISRFSQKTNTILLIKAVIQYVTNIREI